eukprot:6806544-Prymnesium_polylepis.1
MKAAASCTHSPTPSLSAACKRAEPSGARCADSATCSYSERLSRLSAATPGSYPVLVRSAMSYAACASCVRSRRRWKD